MILVRPSIRANAGRNGLFAPLLNVATAQNGTPHPAAYFWLTGLLSALLDDAPTYLVFFQLAGGSPRHDARRHFDGRRFHGRADVYRQRVHFMVYAIASERGVKMPSFFGYTLWSSAVLPPVFALLTAVFVARP
jgi:Na+/H+ antiporter NhaD/arsenite permease-like protein